MITAELLKKLCEAADEIKRLRADYANACKMVADMHAAAVGAKVGPVAGVVEDVMVLRAERDGLRKEIERLRLDAARYRWLRDNPWPPILEADILLHRNARWDAAIDAAMKQ